MTRDWSTKKVLIVIKTYPAPAQKGIEISCTAGITEDGKWIRLFPIPYRLLEADRRFRKYQWIELNVAKARSDHRPESYNADVDTIRLISEPLSTKDKWQERKQIVLPLTSPSLCQLKAERNTKGFPTLGIVKPGEIRRLIIEEDNVPYTPGQLARLRQKSMFGASPAKELEKIPYNFKYEFGCATEGCPGHMLTCNDWEMHQSFRKWSQAYRGGWDEKFRQRYETEMIEKNDTHFYVGTLHQFPDTWLIVGLFYPRL